LEDQLVSPRFNSPSRSSTKLGDTSFNKLNPDVSTYWHDEFTERRTNFSRQQIHEEFETDIRHDTLAFQHPFDEGPKDNEMVEEEDGMDEGEDDEEDEEEEEEDEDKTDPDFDLSGDTDDVLLHRTPDEDQEKQPEEEENIAVDEADIQADTELGNHTRGQIAAYASVALSMSFRKHFFSMLILGRYARFIRWDRRGAVVTHRFDYTKHPLYIFNFYLRYGQLGLLPPKPVRDAFQRYHHSAWYGGAKFKRGDSFLSFEGFFRVQVTDDVTLVQETFYIPPPKYTRACLHPFWHSTRRCLATLAYPYQKNQKKMLRSIQCVF